jgi:hypothetical protein
VWLVAGPILLITFVLGVIAISLLLASLIVVPVFVFIAPIVRSGIRRALVLSKIRFAKVCAGPARYG